MEDIKEKQSILGSNLIWKKILKKRMLQYQLQKRDRQKMVQMKRIISKLRKEREPLLLALQDQKQISNSWYKELISVKKALQERNEKLLNYELAHNGTYESAVEAEAGRRLKNISEPLSEAVGNSLQTVLGLVESLTQIKTLVGKLATPPANAVKPRRTNNHKVCPPLGSVSTSRRKNVVHPMVEGHVLQPAKISLSRMCLLRSDKLMQLNRNIARSERHLTHREVIPIREQLESSSNADSPIVETVVPEVTTVIEEQATEIINSEISEALPLEDTRMTSQLINNVEDTLSSTNIEQAKGIECTPIKHTVSRKRKELSNTPVVDAEDPLEGPSWLYRNDSNESRRQLLQKMRRSRSKRIKGFKYIESDNNSSDSDADTKEMPSKAFKRSQASSMKKRNSVQQPAKRKSLRERKKKLPCHLSPASKMYQSTFPKTVPDKENVPPVKQMKLKGVSIIVKDCMKNSSKETTNTTPLLSKTSPIKKRNLKLKAKVKSSRRMKSFPVNRLRFKFTTGGRRRSLPNLPSLPPSTSESLPEEITSVGTVEIIPNENLLQEIDNTDVPTINIA